MDLETLRSICAFFGLRLGLDGREGGRPEVSPATAKSLLAALGIEIPDNGDLTPVLDDLRLRYWQRPVDPVVMAPEKSGPIHVTLRLAEADLDRTISWTLTEEKGDGHAGTIPAAELAVQQRQEMDGRGWVALDLPLPLTPPLGYHRLKIRIGEGEVAGESGIDAFLLVVVTPQWCYLAPALAQGDRIWGFSCRLDGLRSRRNWGAGDFTDLGTLLAWGAEIGAGAAAVNALHGSATGRQFLDPLYLDPEAVTEFGESDEAREMVRDPAFQARLAALRDQDEVDCQEVIEAKRTVLEVLWHHFQANHLDPETERGAAFRNFQRAGGEPLRAHGLYQALRDHFRNAECRMEDWTAWPEPYHHPDSPEVVEFAGQHRTRLDFYNYVQWQAERQLEGLGRRSMEFGLKVGLLLTLERVAARGFETWYHRPLFLLARPAEGALGGSRDPGDVAADPPLFLPAGLAEAAYGPFIAMLRANMRYAGGLLIKDPHLLASGYWRPVSGLDGEGLWIGYAPGPLLDIIALESRRSNCLVIAEEVEGLTEDLRAALRGKGIMVGRQGLFTGDLSGGRQGLEEYGPETVVAAGPAEATTMAGFWLGTDIPAPAASLVPEEEQRAKMIIARAGDRARLLVALHRAGLLPEGYDVDPAAVPRLTPELGRAIHLLLARTPACIFLARLEDLAGIGEAGAEHRIAAPGAARRPKVAAHLEAMREDESVRALLRLLNRERNVGVVRPSAQLAERRARQQATIPGAFYRLQLNRDFTFPQAAGLVDYLKDLGISHCYVSPYLKARPGSRHGYDIIDHTSLNPEIGSRQEFEIFVAALERHGMAQLLDMVPNHMGVGPDNRWWLDVLENGPASPYASFFDINWQPRERELTGRVLLPVLGDYYGEVLENGELQLVFVPEKGGFEIVYYDHRYPIAPETYPLVLGRDLQRLADRLGGRHEGLLELQGIVASLEQLPGRAEEESGPGKNGSRQRHKEALKRQLARLCREVPEIGGFIEENVILVNGEKGRSESFDPLHQLLDMQAYRLAFWRVAAEEVNYRRFFDINDLAGIRVEDERVFEETHRFVLDLIATGKVDGLRIDHPDGLYDPRRYFQRLQEAVSGGPVAMVPSGDGPPVAAAGLPLYVVAEKILALDEELPVDWQVHGTTGYDFANLVNGLFVDPAGEKAITGLYHRFIGQRSDFEALRYNCKKQIIRLSMSGELNVLAGQLHSLAKENRHTRDYTLNGLREALIEVVAYFPVYRTYVSGNGISATDRRYIERAVQKARQRERAEVTAMYDFVRQVLLLETPRRQNEEVGAAVVDFVMKLQQYTAPVMAKGMEDTSFYIYNRLLSLNEVGGDPRCFGVSVEAFHEANRRRLRKWPHGMLATSTHDSKRGEDVRARIDVLSELPDAWREALIRWGKLNHGKKTRMDTGWAPSRNDEYGLYQNLLGIWPMAPPEPEERRRLVERLEAATLKAIREAKVHTSWINPDEAYEAATTRFVRLVLGEENRDFREHFSVLHRKVARFGMFNSLAQLLLKLTSPGVPDIYQGNEIWRFSLVDPDNRRPVDFDKRRKLLAELPDISGADPAEAADRVRSLLDSLEDGRAKLHVIRRTLRYRGGHGDLFERGDYLPLTAVGEKADHLCAFARRLDGQLAVVAVPRLAAGLLGRDESILPLGPEVWRDTYLLLPPGAVDGVLYNILTGEELRPAGDGNRHLAAADFFRSFPVALLANQV